jgi:ABC-type transport system involved in cytochrome bd biosynthesis fused ATPase/permease subunit
MSIALGALAVIFGIGLMASAGYLIARAAEQPAILSLTTVIVAVRFFGLARPVARYFERLSSHDPAFRVLARIRVRFYERIEPLAPAGLAEYRRGDLVSRMVGDVDALQSLYLRGLGPPLVAIVAGGVAVGVAAAILPVAALLLAAGLLLAESSCRSVSGLTGRLAGRRRASAQGHLSAELVELLRGAPELVVYGREEEALRRFQWPTAAGSLARRDALAAGVADGLAIFVAGVTTVAVLAAAVSAHAAGDLDRVLVAALTLLALASFEAVAPSTRGARAHVHARRGTCPRADGPRAGGARTLRADRGRARDGCYCIRVGHRPLLGGRTARAGRFQLSTSHPAGESLVGASGIGKTTVVNLLLRFLDLSQGGSRSEGTTSASTDRRTYAGASLSLARTYLFSTSIRENVRLACPEATDAEIDDALRQARVGDWVASLPEGAATLVGEEERSSRAASVSALL